MRVIAGKYKGKPLYSPMDNSVRPTTDRVKETIFNILNSKIELLDAKVLDLFSGSGALGIEALSRGAASCVFCDVSPDSIRLTKENLKYTGATGEVYIADYALALKKLKGRKFDLIFLDPPYADGKAEDALKLIIKYDLIALNGIIVVEQADRNSLQNVDDGFIIDKRKFGNTAVSFLTKEVL